MCCFVYVGKMPRRILLIKDFSLLYKLITLRRVSWWWHLMVNYPRRRHKGKFSLQVRRNGTLWLEMWYFVYFGKTPPRRFTSKRLLASIYCNWKPLLGRPHSIQHSVQGMLFVTRKKFTINRCSFSILKQLSSYTVSYRKAALSDRMVREWLQLKGGI